ncbi:hypothetical protein [Nonomuraea sp. NPDC050540]|uniref:hypothetical protein n=1 Tax=Nonomuraea sp. NPDC050540 TaxID=3364367 RepID=UPI0037AAA28C
MSHPFPSSCSPGCSCGLRDLVTAAHEAEERRPTEIDNAEMRALLASVQSGYETIRGDVRLAQRRHTVQTTHARARRQLNAMETWLAAGTVRAAAASFARAAARAAQGSRRPRWLRVIRWPVVITVGTFDAWYFMQVFRFLTATLGDAVGGGQLGLWERIVPMVPGVVIAVALAVSGSLLLIPLRAWREATLRPGGRVVRLLWWCLPVVFVGMLLTVVAVWAGLRSAYPVPPRQGYPLFSVMLLITMLSLGAIVTKVMADDPEADALGAARRRLFWQRVAYQRQARRAEVMIARYESAWSDLRTLRDELVGLLRLKAVSAWEAFILRTRALHRRAGNVTALPVAPPVGPEPSMEGMVLPEFEEVRQPRPELGPLHEICRLIEEQDPDELLEHLDELAEEYRNQLAGPRHEVLTATS